MKIGCCTSMVSSQPDGTGIEFAGCLKQVGFDYIELSLAHLMALPEEELLKMKNVLKTSRIPCEACHNFVPPHIKLTGPAVDFGGVIAHMEKAVGMASGFGAEVIVFGSGPAKKVPHGFPTDKAWAQLVELLKKVDTVAGKYEVTIVIEPLRKAECNIINSVEEGLELVREVNKPNIKLLADYYHMSEENENPRIILKAGDNIRHIHMARAGGRGFPENMEEDGYMPFILNLRKIGYDGRISVEAYSKDFYTDAVKSHQFLRENF